MKLTRTPAILDLDHPRRIIFNMHVRKQLEELQTAGELNIAHIFQETDGARTMNWDHAMKFVAIALQEDAIAHGEALAVDDVERLIDSVPAAIEIVGKVFDEYGKFLGIEPGEATPASVKDASAGAGSRAGHAKRLSASSAENTESLPASSGD